jgi:DNA-binding transcriptional LysR family regulator
MTMEIREMRAFVTVVDKGGLSAAARAMHVSQSALSQTVRSLERQVGGQLLVRDHSGARPTELGMSLLGPARSLVEQHDELMAGLTRPAVPAQRLRVGVPLELPTDLLPLAIAEVTAAHPDARVELRHARSTAQLAALRAGEIEVALVRDRPADPRLESVLAVAEAMGVVLTAAHADELADARGVRLQVSAACPGSASRDPTPRHGTTKWLPLSATTASRSSTRRRTMTGLSPER